MLVQSFTLARNPFIRSDNTYAPALRRFGVFTVSLRIGLPSLKSLGPSSAQ